MMEDVELIVRTRSLCEIDDDIKYTAYMLDCAEAIEGGAEGKALVVGYWIGRLLMLECARDTAEFRIENDIPTNDLPIGKPTPKDYQIPEILNTLQQHDNDIRGLMKRIPPHPTPPLKKKQSKYKYTGIKDETIS